MMTLIYKDVIKHAKHYRPTNVYITTQEHIEISKLLTPKELNLYVLLLNSVALNVDSEYYSELNLGKILNVSPNSISKMKSALKKHKLAYLIKFKGEQGQPMLRLVIGNEQIRLYDLGINIQIQSARVWNKLYSLFPMLEPSLNCSQREQMVKDFNQYCEDHPELFK